MFLRFGRTPRVWQRVEVCTRVTGRFVGERRASLGTARAHMLRANSLRPLSCWTPVRTFSARAGARRTKREDPEPSHYELLGVERTASDTELKRAYMREAKLWHPDINKSPEATERFQKLARAYDVLRDPARRAAYDRGDAQPGPQEAQHGPMPSASDLDPEEVFRAVMEELGVEQVTAYVQSLRQDSDEAVKAARAGDLEPAGRLVWKHKIFASSVVLPMVLMLRFPGLVGAALRFAVQVPLMFLAVCLRDPRFPALVGRLLYIKWRSVASRAAARSREKKKQ